MLFYGPPSGSEPFYCTTCGVVARRNQAFERCEGLMGARVVGFRFNGHNHPDLISLVLKSGRREWEVWAAVYGEDGEEIALKFGDRRRYPSSCYTSKKRKLPPQKRGKKG